MINLKLLNKVMAARVPGSITDYKGLVCVFLGGGCDSYNMLAPGVSGYSDYLTSRGSVAIPQTNMFNIVDSQSQLDYHLNKNMPGVRDMFNAGDLSFLANIGTLVEPMTKLDFETGAKERPIGLFSHFDQKVQWQNSLPNTRGGSLTGQGWVGRMSEILNDAANNNATVNVNMSPAGDNLLQTSRNSRPFPLRGGASGFTLYNQKAHLRNAIDEDLETQYASILQNHYNHVREDSIEQNNMLEALEANTTINTVFPNSDLGNQLLQVAKYIKLQGVDGLKANRQTFYVSQGNYDMHSNVTGRLGGNLSTLSAALKAFNDAMHEIGYHDRVVTYTASDFGRTLSTNGTGTDHGWGGNHILMGGPISGGQVLGDYPNLALGASEDIGRGRMLPTTSIDELHASIAYWFGVRNDNEMETILPNIRNFWSAGSTVPPAPMMSRRPSGGVFRLAILLAGASLIPFSSVQAEFRAKNSTANELIRQCKASHFLSQAGMGGTVQEIEALATRIQQIGYIPACEEWIDQQMALPRGELLQTQCPAMAVADGVDPTKNIIGEYWYLGWWDQVIKAPDQLRHRMAFALSQIMVVSTEYWNGLQRRGRWEQHVRYYDMLMDNTFTSHRDLLQDVTYDAMMGVWLSYAQNDKGDPAQGIYPDENYAREIMQLFSCGVYSQDAWGNYLTDSNGKPIENYDNEDIKEFAQVFTGLSIDDTRPFFSKNLTLLGSGTMVMKNAYHDTSEKYLLNGVVLPAGQDGDVDISQALDNLSTHPSTAPYFSRLLIQRLTSSNPSLAYMKRVTDTWNGGGTYGTGVTGDFKAVLKAILLDPEVRNSISYDKEPSGGAVIVRANPADPLAGKIKEPLLKMAQFYRFAQPVSSAADGYVRLAQPNRAYGQEVLSAKSVFNFYDAGFAPSNGPIGDYVADYEAANPGSTLEVTSPEAQILGGNVVNEFQQFYSLPLSGPGAYRGTTAELTEITNIKNGAFTYDIGLIRHLDVMLCHGQLPYELSLDIENDLKSNGETWDEKVAQIISVIHGSPAYSVIR
eukprot:g3968.t1